jgi:coatomer subunit alpha
VPDANHIMQDLDLPADVPAPAATSSGGAFVAPPPGQPVTQRWLARSKLAAEHAAAGAFDSAFRMLTLQLGITHFEPLKANMLAMHAAAFAHVSGLPNQPAISLGLDAGWSKSSPTAPPSQPTTPFRFAALEKKLLEAYELFTKNKLAESLAVFDNILLVIPLLVVETRKEVDEVKELITICREYHTGIRCALEHRAVEKAGDKPERAAELVAYFTHCALQPKHLAIALRSAMTKHFQAKLYVSCAAFCRRLLELNVPESIAGKARQVRARGACRSLLLLYLCTCLRRGASSLCDLKFGPCVIGALHTEQHARIGPCAIAVHIDL